MAMALSYSSCSHTSTAALLAFIALVGCAHLAFVPGQSSSGKRSALPESVTAQQVPPTRAATVPTETTEGNVFLFAAIGAGALATSLAASVARSSAARKSSAGRAQSAVALRSGLKSPGFNTLPEWEKPLNGFEGQVGVQEPLGYWDPLGFSKDGDVAKFTRRREVEIKHGRVSMFATIGYIVPEYFKLGGDLSPSQGLTFGDVPNGLGAFSKVPIAGWAQILAFAGFLELSYNKPTGEPGNFGKGFLGLGSLGVSASIQDPKTRKKKLAAELANGRLAMMAIIGMFFQDGLTGSAWGDWANFTASPLRYAGDASAPARPAFDPATELGVQEPLGFWDPLGLSADKDEAAFKRRRAVEIKHGRISMYATIGYIVPEYFKFPGYLSPSLGIKFSDVPNGLAALSKLPVLGGAQMVAFAGIIETTGFFSGKATDGRGPRGLGQMKDSTESAEPGNYGVGFPTFLGKVDDPETRKTKLAAELANGRLAMMAIIGMFFQDGLTGSAWGDWSLYTASPLRYAGDASAPARPAFDPATELGVQEPLGFWDPLGLSADKDEGAFKRRRAVEIKHGRISMYATIGYIVPEYFKFPGYLSPSLGIKFSDVPNGLAALSKLPVLGGAQMVAFAGIIETTGFFSGKATDGRGPRGLGQMKDSTESGEPGNYGVGFPTFLGKVEDPEARKTKLAAELANGRLAMMAIIGMFFQDGLTGQAWGDWSLYTASPLRAFESELGVQAPFGFFDPLGLSKDGDVEAFRRRRASEIKHGRVSMYACMGYIVPEYYKIPGYLSPSAGLKFADVPNGLGALAKVPAEGWLQWIALCGFYETVVNEPVEGEPGNYGKGFLGITGKSMTDSEKRKRSLNSEIANGRLAMMAIIGMFFQDGLTGSAWGDWALYTESPLRAFETELGVQAPVGFWDPVGFCQDGDVDVFRRRREAELKHGRVSMFATLGYIVPEYFKWPGYLSPSQGIKFADVPHGLAAISKVPALGWAQIFGFIGLVDFGLYRPDPSRDPGDYENAGILGVPNASGPMSDVEGRKRKLNSELANGRLAMVAIMGMMFQNGTVGDAGPGMWLP